MVHGLMLKVSGKQTAGTKISEYNIKRDVVIDISFLYQKSNITMYIALFYFLRKLQYAIRNSTLKLLDRFDLILFKDFIWGGDDMAVSFFGVNCTKFRY